MTMFLVGVCVGLCLGVRLALRLGLWQGTMYRRSMEAELDRYAKAFEYKRRQVLQLENELEKIGYLPGGPFRNSTAADKDA